MLSKYFIDHSKYYSKYYVCRIALFSTLAHSSRGTKCFMFAFSSWLSNFSLICLGFKLCRMLGKVHLPHLVEREMVKEDGSVVRRSGHWHVV